MFSSETIIILQAIIIPSTIHVQIFPDLFGV